MSYYNIPIFIVHYGCPHQCVFCNQKKITGHETNIQKEDIKKTIDSYLETLPKDSYKEVAFFGGSFTGIPHELQKEYLDEVKPYIISQKIDGVRLSTRPDYINEKILNFLKRNNVTTIELGIQSFDNSVLEKSERGYTNNVIHKAVNLIKQHQFKLGIQIMPGLPMATQKSDLNSIREIVKINPDMVRIYPTLVINETKLEEWYKKELYIPLDLEESIQRIVPMIALLELNDIKIIRVGLQPSDDLREEGVIISGPFHSAYRELAETEIYYRFFINKLNEKDFLNIKVNHRDISKAIGMNKKNKIRLNQKIDIKSDPDIKRNKVMINEVIYNRKDMLANIKKEIEECDYQ
ncbi:MAG: elongator complex protein 3 [Fusobacteriota bacterium]